MYRYMCVCRSVQSAQVHNGWQGVSNLQVFHLAVCLAPVDTPANGWTASAAAQACATSPAGTSTRCTSHSCWVVKVLGDAGF